MAHLLFRAAWVCRFRMLDGEDFVMAYTAVSAMTLSLWEGAGEIGVEAVITYTVTPHYPATLEQPEELPMAEVSNFRLRKPKTQEWLTCPAWISDAFEGDDSFMSWLVSEAADRDASDRDAAAEAAWEDRRLEP